MLSWRFLTIGWLLASVVPLGFGTLTMASDEVPTPVEQVRTSLRRLDSVPWYDSSGDAVRELEKDNTTWSLENVFWTGPTTWTGSTALASVLRIIFWIILASIFLVLLMVMMRYAKDRQFFWRRDVKRKPSTESVTSIVDQLPLSWEAPLSEFLEKTSQLYQEHRYSDAIVCFFYYQLVALDRRQFIRLAHGKTNRQYLYELHSHPRLQPLVERTVLAFEDVFFGKHFLNRKRFEACWQELSEFERLTQHSSTT